MKKRSFAYLTAALLLLSSCTGDSDVTSADTVAQTVPVQTVSLEAVSASLDGDALRLTLSCSGVGFNGTLRASASSGADTVETTRILALDSEVAQVELALEQISRLNGNFDVSVTAEGDESAQLSFSYKNSLPQLSADSVKLVVQQLTNEEKAALVCCFGGTKISGSSGYTAQIDRLGIPGITLADGPAGVRVAAQAVQYPTGMTTAATWDIEAMKSIGSMIGSDSRALGVDIILAPGMNLQKNLLNGRNFEYFSEDPYLTGVLAAAYTNGVQSQGVGVAAKHFAANNQELQRSLASSNVTERALRELYLSAFEIMVRESSPYAIMSSYNRLNGTYTSVNRELLTDILRGEFGFDGLVMTDWGAAGDPGDMIKAQNDLRTECDEEDAALMLQYLNDKTVSDEDINRCCENILSVVVKTNAYRGERIAGTISNRDEQRAQARKIAADGMVLLKNDGALPFASGEVALFGNAAVHTVISGFGSGNVGVNDAQSITEAFSQGALALNDTVKALYAGCTNHTGDDVNPANDTREVAISPEQAQAAASRSDIALIVLSRTTTEGEDHSAGKGDYELNDAERTLIENVSAAFSSQGKKTVVVLNMGNAFEVASWRESVDAIIFAGLAGDQTGYALYDIVTGAVNPSGKLPFTFPVKYSDTPASEYYPGNVSGVEYYEDIYVGYRYYSTFDIDTAYEFGYGLSYTTFEYSPLTLSSDKFTQSLTASITVTNTGTTAGREVVQLYVTKPQSAAEQPVYALAGFAKTKLLAPGEKETLSFEIGVNELKTYVAEGAKWVVGGGEYTLSAAASVKDIKASASFGADSDILVLQTTNLCAPVSEFPIITRESGKVSIYGDIGENIALNKPATGNGEEGEHVAPRANDGIATTRWSGIGGSGSSYWWSVDLQGEYALSKVIIKWESNTSDRYTLLISSDGKRWTELSSGSAGSTTVIDCKGEKASFVRIAAPSGGWLSIFECEIYAR